jgi:hypothetical protein
MTNAERFSLATHLYVRLRRANGRVVDALWMSQNDEYAREILRIAAQIADPEVQNLVGRFWALMGGPQRRAAAAAPPSLEVESDGEQQYVGTLR